MKVIDLLNRIANGYKEIKDKYELKINTYLHCHYVPECLNDEVEIIEDKKIRKLPKEVRQPNNFEEVVYIAEDLVNKINEIIDKINSMEVK